MEENIEKVIKIIFLGESQVGKTCLLHRFAKGIFKESYAPTIGVDFQIKHLKIQNEAFCVHLWDTAGQERFRAITKQFYQNANGVLVCFDLTKKDGLDSIRPLLSQLNSDLLSYNTPKVLIGTKCDVEKSISNQEIEEISNECEVQHFETSAKTGENVEEAFEYLLNQIRISLNEEGNSFLLAGTKGANDEEKQKNFSQWKLNNEVNKKKGCCK